MSPNARTPYIRDGAITGVLSGTLEKTIVVTFDRESCLSPWNRQMRKPQLLVGGAISQR